MRHFKLMALVVLAGGSSAAAESLPLEPGYYVARDTPCENASNATITLYNGGSFGAAHAECRKPVVRKLSDSAYELTRSCRDMQGRGGKWQAAKSRYSVQSRTEFTETTPYGTFAFRYCNRSDLPDPWKTNDLSRDGIK